MGKKIFALIVVAFLILSLVSMASGQEPEEITVWTDRSEYALGETGTLYIAFYNDKPDAVTIEKIFIIFNNWRAYRNGQWEGNQTLEVNEALVSKGVCVTETTFVVPTDGRGGYTSVDIIIRTTERGDIFIPSPYTLILRPSITVTETPKHMEQIVTLFTVQVVLTIICTIIIAGTIFLSSRRPKMMWQKEEREK